MDEADHSPNPVRSPEPAGGCPECGATLLHAQGCLNCGSCGYSRCG